MILRHENCQIARCETCMEDHELLGQKLAALTRDYNTDHLGRYHLWLTQNNIPAETTFGWASAESFDEDNIYAYVVSWCGQSSAP